MAVIEVNGLHKTFQIPHERRTTLTERVLGLFRPVPYERFEALRGVDLAIDEGSFVGVIGNNGSGKSTLLKVIAGLLVPDAGKVRVQGTLSALLELGLGFSPELTVRENVELYGAVLGYPWRQMAARIDAAVRFAELERFRDAKLKNLSTGMQMRLGFATALQARSDILLLDEILAVGDASFQRKCLDVFSELKRRRKTVVLVSHDLMQIRRFCNRVVLIEQGRVAASGDPDRVIARHLEGAGSEESRGARKRVRGVGDGQLQLRDGWVENDAGERVTSVKSGDCPTLVLLIDAQAEADDPVFGAVLQDGKGMFVYVTNTLWRGLHSGHFHAGQTLEVRLRFLAALRNGHYSVDAAVTDREGVVVHDWTHGLVEFAVTGSASRDGEADLQGEFSWRVVEQGRDPNVHRSADGGGAR